MSPTIAIVDDDLAICELLEDLLTDEGYQVECYNDRTSFFNGLEEHVPALLIFDLHLERMFGVWEILTELRSRPITSTMPIIVSTTDPFLTQEHLDEFQALHAIVIDKPFEIETVIETVTQVLEGQ